MITNEMRSPRTMWNGQARTEKRLPVKNGRGKIVGWQRLDPEASAMLATLRAMAKAEDAPLRLVHDGR